MKDFILAAWCLTMVPLMTFAGQKAETFETTIEKKVALDYLLYLPSGYTTDTEKKWPLMLFLHGAGERGDDVENVKKHGPPKLIEADKEFPCIVVSPQCPKRQWWNAQELMLLIKDIEKHYRVDPKRIYVTGLSMGGYGTWALAAEYPDYFAAIMPICGGGDPDGVSKIADMPIWVFHGEADQTVTIEKSEEMVNALKAAGSEVIFTRYPDAGHGSWTRTYDNPKVYEWLFEQVKQP